jgi:hypothetical protein
MASLTEATYVLEGAPHFDELWRQLATLDTEALLDWEEYFSSLVDPDQDFEDEALAVLAADATLLQQVLAGHPGTPIRVPRSGEELVAAELDGRHLRLRALADPGLSCEGWAAPYWALKRLALAGLLPLTGLRRVE